VRTELIVNIMMLLFQFFEISLPWWQYSISKYRCISINQWFASSRTRKWYAHNNASNVILL